MGEATVAGQRLGDGSLGLSIAEGRGTALADVRQSGGGTAKARVAIDRGEATSADLSADGWRLGDLDAIRARWPSVSGTMAVRGSLTGPTARPSGDLSVTLSDLQSSGRLPARAVG